MREPNKTMGNASKVTSVVLSVYFEMEEMRYVYFAVFLVLYLFIVVTNVTLIAVICVERVLHEPMYFFLCNLAVNGLYGSTSIFPSLMSNLVSLYHEVPLACCQAQVFCLHTYTIVEFTILAVMGYDRFLAICHPLQYHSIMSVPKVRRLIAFSWLYPFTAFGALYSITLMLPLCGRTIDKLYCSNYSLVKLSCADTAAVNVAGLLSVVLYSLPQLCMTLYSYAHILRICVASSRDSRIKALKTCAPHIIALVNYTIGCYFEIVQSRQSISRFSFETVIFMSLYFLIFPPVLNPAVYGMSIKVIRVNVLKRFTGKKQLWPTQ